MSSKLLFVPIGLMLLAGCNTVHPQSESVDPGFGEAQKYNAAVQTIDPDPVYAEDGSQPGENGDRAAQSVKRYRTGSVKAVEAVGTTSGGGGPQ